MLTDKMEMHETIVQHQLKPKKLILIPNTKQEKRDLKQGGSLERMNFAI